MNAILLRHRTRCVNIKLGVLNLRLRALSGSVQRPGINMQQPQAMGGPLRPTAVAYHGFGNFSWEGRHFNHPQCPEALGTCGKFNNAGSKLHNSAAVAATW